MPSIAKEMVRCLKTLEKATGNPTFTWNKQVLICMGNSAGADSALGMGGFGLSSHLIINIRLSVFGTGAQPLPNQKGTYSADGKIYRIDEIRTPPGQAFIQLALIDPTRGV